MKTAIEELIEKVKNGGLISKDVLIGWMEKAKVEEKQQIIGAYKEGEKNVMIELASNTRGIDMGIKTAEQYYNNNF